MGKTFERNQKVEAAPLNEESILFDPASSRFFMLNRVSAFVWEQLSAPSTAEAIAAAVVDSFADVTSETAIADVSSTLDELVSLDLAIATEES